MSYIGSHTFFHKCIPTAYKKQQEALYEYDILQKKITYPLKINTYLHQKIIAC